MRFLAPTFLLIVLASLAFPWMSLELEIQKFESRVDAPEVRKVLEEHKEGVTLAETTGVQVLTGDAYLTSNGQDLKKAMIGKSSGKDAAPRIRYAPDGWMVVWFFLTIAGVILGFGLGGNLLRFTIAGTCTAAILAILLLQGFVTRLPMDRHAKDVESQVTEMRENPAKLVEYVGKTKDDREGLHIVNPIVGLMAEDYPYQTNYQYGFWIAVSAAGAAALSMLVELAIAAIQFLTRKREQEEPELVRAGALTS